MATIKLRTDEMVSADAYVVATEPVHVEGLPILGSLLPIRRNALAQRNIVQPNFQHSAMSGYASIILSMRADYCNRSSDLY